MSKKKIWVIAFEFAPFPGGQATYACEMAKAFVRMGYSVTVVAPRYENAVERGEGFEVIRVFEHQKLNLSSVAAIFRAMRSLQSGDIVLAADIRAGIVATLLRARKKFTKIVMFHGGEIKRSEHSRFAKLSNQFAAAFAQRAVANSSYTADLIKAYVGGNPMAPLLGVARYWFEPAAGMFENLSLRALPADVPVICTVARLESRKGHLVAMKALRAMAERTDINFRYVMCGKTVDESYAAEVRAMAGNFPEKFLYVGVLSKDDVRRLYARSQIMFLPAQDEPRFIEGFGLVITEAGAQGCPSISTRVGGIADAIIDGKTGILCDPLDTEGLARNVELLLRDAAKRQALGKAARDYSESLTWDVTAAKTLSGLS